MSMTTVLKSDRITLRPATPADRWPVFTWLTQSDISGRMFGPPLFPEIPVPGWKDFSGDYQPHFFDGSAPLGGRCFIIQVDGKPVGQVNHDVIAAGRTELDIWMKNAACTGRGYGPDALRTLMEHLKDGYGCATFYIAPARRNVPAVAAYAKAGFTETAAVPEWFEPDTDDAVLMVRCL